MAVNPPIYVFSNIVTAAGVVAQPLPTGVANAPSSGLIPLPSVATVHMLSVSGVGGTPSAWNVVLQVSGDGVNWTSILSHSSANTPAQTSGQIVSNNGASNQSNWPMPAIYARINVLSLTLGPATGLRVIAEGRF